MAKLFADASAAVVGLHTVFEHHDVMTLAATGLLLHEYRIRLPAGVDEPIEDDDPIARTMRAYALRGTPSTVLIDAEGRFRQQMFSAHPGLVLGAAIGVIVAEAGTPVPRHGRLGQGKRVQCEDGCDHEQGA